MDKDIRQGILDSLAIRAQEERESVDVIRRIIADDGDEAGFWHDRLKGHEAELERIGEVLRKAEQQGQEVDEYTATFAARNGEFVLAVTPISDDEVCDAHYWAVLRRDEDGAVVSEWDYHTEDDLLDDWDGEARYEGEFHDMWDFERYEGGGVTAYVEAHVVRHTWVTE